MRPICRWAWCWLAPLALAGCGSSSAPVLDPNYNPEDYVLPPGYGGPTREPMVCGEVLPKLDCAGWFNGEPKPFAASEPGIRVVDVWTQWCPQCQNFADSLKEVHGRYRDRNVQFVSVTDMPRKVAEKFVLENSLPWPCGYGLKADAVVEMGAVNQGMAAFGRGYLIAPTLFVVGRDGKVWGSDERARWRHQPKEDVVAALVKLIDGALAAK